MENKDKFPRIPKNAFGDQTGWLYAGALVAKSQILINAINGPQFGDNVDYNLKISNAINELRDTIEATLEAAYAPTSPACDTPPKDESWQQP